jgi:hypothetical protein
MEVHMAVAPAIAKRNKAARERWKHFMESDFDPGYTSETTPKAGALLVLGLLLAFGLIDRAVAQQQSPPGQGQVQVVPQSPPETSGYKAPKPYQVTPQTSQPTPMYPQYQVSPDTKAPKQQK